MEKWQESGLSQYEFCNQESLSKSTFGYWLKKYRQEKSDPGLSPKKPGKTFLPVKFTTSVEPSGINPGYITISYPNGIQVNCPLSPDAPGLKNLTNH